MDSGEQCDGAALGSKTCVKLGYHYGKLGCKSDCKFNVTGCKKFGCGDGIVSLLEQCDGNNLNGKTCVKLGYHYGKLGCKNNCLFNKAGCTNCGNALLNPGEQCDGAALGGKTCKTYGYTGGALSCRSNCKVNKAACYKCGDWKINNASEQCDGPALGGKSCKSFGYVGGKLSCTSGCTYNKSKCHNCGDGKLGVGEQCDGALFGGKTCQTLGYAKGSLTCKACKIYSSGCTNCGNGQVDYGEQCDGANLGGTSCTKLGYSGGSLSCTSGCKLNKSACSKCGDGKINAASEQCDWPSLAGKTCKSFGYYTGKLSCTTGCAFSISGCHNCGDGKLGAGEACDGKNYGGKTCQTEGYHKGSLACYGCKLYTSGCSKCGDGQINASNEQCDGAALGGKSCKTLGYWAGTLACTSGCKLNKGACHFCGNGKLNYGEQCDGAAFGNKTCKSLGFDGGKLACSSGCKRSTAGCWKIKTVGDDTFSQFDGGKSPERGVKLWVTAAGSVQLLDRLDLDGDGHLDLVFSNRFNGVSSAINSYIYFGTATGPAKQGRVGLPTLGAAGASAADLNGDGHLDLVFANSDLAKKQGNSLVLHQREINSYIYWGSGSGYAAANRTELPTVGAAGNAVADLNGDGYLDIVFANRASDKSVLVNSYIYWGSASGFSKANRAELPTSGARGVTVADLDGDGRLEIVISNASDGTSNKVNSFIYWGTSTGYSAAKRGELPTVGAAGNTVADLDGDGKLEIVFANNGDGATNAVDSYIYWGGASGYAVTNRTSLPSVGAAGVSVADVDGDGRLDIVLSCQADGTKTKLMSQVYHGSAAGFSKQHRTLLPTVGAGGNLVADLNGDGYPDVTFANAGDGKASWQVDSTVYWGSKQGLSAGQKSGLLTVGAAGVLPAADLGAVRGRGATQAFVSRALDTGLAAPVFHQLWWKGTVPTGTTLKIQLRSAATVVALQSATWYGPASTSGSYPKAATALNPAHQGQRYVQYRAVLSSSFGDTPVLDSVTVSYH